MAADSLFGNENPVGKTIDIKGEPFIVVGVIEESTAFSPVINSVEDYYTYVYNDGSASGIVAVSYTHLDVYKRQEISCLNIIHRS